MKIKTKETADVNITSLIDCLMQCIIFFMVIMSAQYVYGVAIKFAPPNSQKQGEPPKKEKSIIVYVQADYLDRAPDGGHLVVQDGILKLNDEEFALVGGEDIKDRSKWPEARQKAFDYLRLKMKKLIVDEGYRKDMLLIRGDNKTYQGKIMSVVDAGKADSIEAFSLIPPSQ
jgi:biopolymer transport protein ExbD